MRWGTAEFFERHRDGSRRSAAIAVPLLVEQFEPRSVVDVGWGTGVWLSVFHEHGVTDILGIDGPWVKEPQREIPDSFFGECDLTQPLTLDRTFDPALCLEVAEHPASRGGPAVSRELDSPCSRRRVLRRDPGPGGRRPYQREMAKFLVEILCRTWVCLLRRPTAPPMARRCGRILVPAEHAVFCCGSPARSYDRASRGNEGSAVGPLDVVHPQLYLRVFGDLEWRRRDVDRLEREIQETRAELRKIKSSRVWRFYQSIRCAVVGARRVSSRFSIGAGSKAKASDRSN